MNEDMKEQEMQVVTELDEEVLNNVAGGGTSLGDRITAIILYCKLCNSKCLGHAFTKEEESAIILEHVNEPLNYLTHKDWRTKPVIMSTYVFN